MNQRKICMLGASAVGKSSLVAKFVHGIFSDRYLSTLGVKIDRKDVHVDETVLRLILWDLHGDDAYQQVRASYLAGMHGYLLVMDGTRPETITVAKRLHQLAMETAGNVPFVALLNKSDLVSQWTVTADAEQELRDDGWPVYRASAKEGENVEHCFELLARRLHPHSS